MTEAIRRQYLAAGLVPPERVVALPGGVDATVWRPDRDGRALRASVGVPDDVPLIGLLGGFRVMKGHAVALEAAAELARRGRRFHLALALATHNTAFVQIIHFIWDELLTPNALWIRLRARRAVRPTRVAEHQAIFDAVAAHDPGAARAAMHAHFEGAIRDFLERSADA